jgi:hypothetical protein
LNKRISGRVLGNEPTIFLNDEILSNRVDDSHPGFKGRRNPTKCDLIQNLARKSNSIQEPSQRRFDGGYEITSRCIVFGSPVASSYTQSSSITPEQEKSNNDVTSALTACNSQKIPIWCCSI